MQMKSNPSAKSLDIARATFRASEGVLRTSEALACGVQRRTLYWMRDHELIESLSRGVWHLVEYPLPSSPDVASVMRRVPRAVLCLVSALEFHEIGTQVPSEVQIALPQGMKAPRIAFPRVRTFWMSQTIFNEGIETHKIDGSDIRVYGAAKTVADCFKFRSKIGHQIAVEALQATVRNRRATPSEIMRYAKIDRVESYVRPFLEALT